VDCGLFQERDLNERNWTPFPFPAGALDAVLLTHAHLDHCGLLPKLVKEGFRGKVYCSPATADIAKIILRDSANIQEEDADRKKRRHQKEGRTGRHPEVPLYTVRDAERAIRHLKPIRDANDLPLDKGIHASFHNAGHILGSTCIRIKARDAEGERVLLFSGDLGRWNAPIIRDPTLFPDADYVLVESTYGDRTHPAQSETPVRLAEVVRRTCEAGGNIVVPSFAVERAQDLLYHIGALLREGRIPRIPVFLDSPAAASVTDVFRRHLELFDSETRTLLEEGNHPCNFPGLTICRTVEESKAINRHSGSAVIIAGSGMCTGGRIKHHLAHNIGRSENTILFVGYQAAGTLGRVIQNGAPEIRIHGQTHAVRARIERIDGFSAHADRDELFRWISALRRPPRRVFVVHGEPDAANAFAARLRADLSWPVSVPAYLDEALLE
jgi:metallo-beta-lactamase family protein